MTDELSQSPQTHGQSGSESSPSPSSSSSSSPSSPSTAISPTRRFLSRDDIFLVDDTQYEDVEVPEWHGWVRVRGLSGEERDALEQTTIRGRGRNMSANYENWRAKLVAAAIVDQEGRTIFTSHDVLQLGKKSVAALQRVYDVAGRLSGVSQGDEEELLGNSQNGHSDASRSS